MANNDDLLQSPRDKAALANVLNEAFPPISDEIPAPLVHLMLELSREPSPRARDGNEKSVPVSRPR
jgi:hypothetical protein